MTTLALLVAGGFGALARYELGALVQRRAATPRPWGTATVNLLGALGLGVLVALGRYDLVGEATVRALGVGFFGGFTTFSTWMLESVLLAEEGRRSGKLSALVNLGAQLLAGVGLTALIAVLTPG
ncbi:MAG: fluoride efflux transporter FluC [Egibacteraceae bacterium]